MPVLCLYKAATGGDEKFTALHYLAFVPVYGLIAAVVWGVYALLLWARQAGR